MHPQPNPLTSGETFVLLKRLSLWLPVKPALIYADSRLLAWETLDSRCKRLLARSCRPIHWVTIQVVFCFNWCSSWTQAAVEVVRNFLVFVLWPYCCDKLATWLSRWPCTCCIRWGTRVFRPSVDVSETKDRSISVRKKVVQPHPTIIHTGTGQFVDIYFCFGVVGLFVF